MMKKTFILSTLLAVALVAGLLFVSCNTSTSGGGGSSGGGSSGGNTGIVPTELRGTWKGNDQQAGITVTVTSNSLSATKGSENLRISITDGDVSTNSSSRTNATFPSGYYVEGKVTTITSGFATQLSVINGQDVTWTVYLHATNSNRCIIPVIADDVDNYFQRQ